MAVSTAPRLPLLSVLLALTEGCPPATLDSREVLQQHPPYTVTPQGGSINITCSIHGWPLLELEVKQHHWPETVRVMHYETGKGPSVCPRFEGRIAISRSQHSLTIVTHRLQPNDTGTYLCQATFMVGVEVWSPGTLVLVTATMCQGTKLTHLNLLMALSGSCLLLSLGLGALCVLRRTQIKKLLDEGKELGVCGV